MKRVINPQHAPELNAKTRTINRTIRFPYSLAIGYILARPLLIFFLSQSRQKPQGYLPTFLGSLSYIYNKV